MFACTLLSLIFVAVPDPKTSKTSYSTVLLEPQKLQMLSSYCFIILNSFVWLRNILTHVERFPLKKIFSL